ncbi:MAG: hypothetical protein Q7S27_00230 [Nanoarchaeota archaeon]|nr:hypothetical protein [Nanoarchaeota archaeon]
MKNKPRGYWQDINNVFSETQKFLEKHPEYETIPGHDALIKLGYSNLSHAINRYHGGFYKFRVRIGGKARYNYGSWKNLEFTLNEAKRCIQELEVSTLPNSLELLKLGYSHLAHSIQRYHGGIRNIREKLGESQKIRKHGLWKDIEYTIQETISFFSKHPEFTTLPSADKLKSLGHGYLASAICRNHGGMDKFRNILSQHQGVLTQKERLENLLQNYVGKENEE